jgi:hypothetical protein
MRSSFDSASEFSEIVISNNNSQTTTTTVSTPPTTSSTKPNGEYVHIEAQTKTAVETAKELFKNTNWKLERQQKNGAVKQFVLPTQDALWFLRIELTVPVPKKVWDFL